MIDRWKKRKEILETSASTMLQEALRSGAEKAEVCLGYGAKTKIGFEKQDFHLASSDDGISYGLRVLTQSRQGFVSGNSTDKKDLKDIAQTAVRIAKMSPPNEFNSIEATDNVAKDAPQTFWDDALVDLSLSTQRGWAKAFVGEALKDSRFRLNEGTLGIEGSLFLVSSSVGTHKLHRETSAVWSLMGMAAEGAKITSFDYFSELARSFATIAERVIQSASHFREQVVSNLKTGPAQSYRGVVVFSPRAVLDILARPLTHHINGRTLVDGSSRWSPAMVGKPVVSEQLTLKDTPWNTNRFGATVFDREGNPTTDRTLVNKGVLSSLILDLYSAKGLGLKSTGNAVGGPGAIPTSGMHNLYVAPGTLDLHEWFKGAPRKEEGILLVNRFSGRTDPNTGDYSGVAKGSEWWIKGERSYFVQDTLISGNLFETLAGNLIGLTRESLPVDCNGDSPFLIADGVSVTWANS